MRFRSIRIKLYFLIAIISIPVIVSKILYIKDYKKELIQNKIEYNINLSKSMSEVFQLYIENIWNQLGIINTYISSNENLSHENISKYLENITSSQKPITHLLLINNLGNIVAASNQNFIGKYLDSTQLLNRITSGEDNIISHIEHIKSIDMTLLPVAKAMKKSHELDGILVAAVNIQNMGDQLSKLITYETISFKIIDNQGNIVYQNNSPHSIMIIDKIPAYSSAWEALEGKIVTDEVIFDDSDKTYKLGCSYPIGKTGWALSIQYKSDEITHLVYKRAIWTITYLVFLISLSIATVIFMSNTILKPILKLKNAASQMINGDYSVRTNITGNDEIAITAQTFDSMAESIQKHDNEKSQIFINLSHEFKTPLNVILASLQLIDKFHDTAKSCSNYNKLHEQLLMMKQNCYRLVRIVTNIIDLSKHNHGFLKLQLQNANIVSIVENITMSIVKFANMKNIDLIFDTDIEEKIMAIDPDAIERIMLNLISNAIKFTKEGGSVYINIYDKDDKIIISVKDTGIGIPESSLGSIFDRFNRIDNALSKNMEGSGIGLSLVKALIESHKGTISVKSVVNQGTEFIIELPVYLVENENDDITDNNENLINIGSRMERINIEFSDIYQLN